MSDLKSLFGLYVETKVADDESKNLFVSSSGLFSCICASYDKEKLESYAKTLNVAEEIRVKLLPYCIISFFYVKLLRFVE